MERKERDLSVDLIKVIAMLSVIALHTFCGTMEWRSANIFYESAVIAVPLFFMVSGYLLVGKQKADWAYVGGKVSRISRLVFVLSVMMLIIEFITDGRLSFMHCLKVFFGAFLQKGPLWQCWYLGAMIIIYALLPFINKLKPRTYCAVVVFLGMVETAVFVMNVLYSETFSEMKVIQTFRLWNWLFYFMLGGCMKMLQKKLRNDYLLILIVLMLPLNILVQEELKPFVNSPFCELFYCSAHVTMYAVILFLLVKSVRLTGRGFVSQSVSFISPLFLSVYLLHPFVISWIVVRLPIPSPLDCYAHFLLTCAITVCISHWLNKIQMVKKLFTI